MSKEKEKEKIKKKNKRKTNQFMLIGLLHYCTLLSKEFLLFFTGQSLLKQLHQYGQL